MQKWTEGVRGLSQGEEEGGGGSVVKSTWGVRSVLEAQKADDHCMTNLGSLLVGIHHQHSSLRAPDICGSVRSAHVQFWHRRIPISSPFGCSSQSPDCLDRVFSPLNA
ncbi:hypothetical protein ElyMa_004267100 [Elysia marginata]|uniref:Uncharacterized protein n=1 Tax=Elysia marginata TaxID=1093978 RepID=A0AAV4GSX1_9GAST|nr:hypothetical protein ElyMa_004267100 [Elysia marginata]